MHDLEDKDKKSKFNSVQKEKPVERFQRESRVDVVRLVG